MTKEQQKQLAFFHHSLWYYAQTLSQNDALLIAKISNFRNLIASDIKLSEDSYSNGIAKVGIQILNFTVT